jgi:hypothetical protein
VHGVEIPVRKVLVVATLEMVPFKGVHTPGARIVTKDTTLVVVENKGGGFVAPPPEGSQCAVGSAKFSVDLIKQEIAWTQCLPKEPNAPFIPRTGTTKLTSATVATVQGALAALVVAKKSDICGADKPFENVTVTTPSGSFQYIDAFYSCMSSGRPHVDGIDEAMAQLRDLVN